LTGREYQHLEDLVFCEELGARHALYIIKNLPNYTMSIKWDGAPTIYFGRGSDNKFRLVGKNGWGRELVDTPEELEQWALSRGKNEWWRPKFARQLADLWRTLEPVSHFKGYVYADVLWDTVSLKRLARGNFYFKPNQVTYVVQEESEIGNLIKDAKVGMAMHTLYMNFGDHAGVPISNTIDITGNTVFAMPLTLVTDGIVMPSDKILELEKLVSRHSGSIDRLLEKRSGLSDLRDIIYKYVNYMVKKYRVAKLSDIKEFTAWIDSSTLSFRKQGRIKDLVNSNTDTFVAMFEIVLKIADIKNEVIYKLDQAPANISAMTNSLTGGEGYIIQEEKIKLVPRSRWVPRG